MYAAKRTVTFKQAQKKKRWYEKLSEKEAEWLVSNGEREEKNGKELRAKERKGKRANPR